MRRFMLLYVVSMVLCAGSLPAISRAIAAEGDERDESVKKLEVGKPRGNRVSVVVEVERKLIKQYDVWIAVQPQLAPGTVWLQGTKLIAAKSKRVVFVGTEAALREPESFDILILRAPKGTFKKDGPVNATDLDDLGVEVLATETVERLE